MIKIDYCLTEDIIDFRNKINQPVSDKFDDSAIFISYYQDGVMIGTQRTIVVNSIEQSEYTYYGHCVPYPIVSSFTEGGMIYVLPEYRNLTISKEIINEFYNLAKQNNKRFVVGASEARLFKLYKKLGFSFIEEKELVARDKKINSVLFFKEI